MKVLNACCIENYLHGALKGIKGQRILLKAYSIGRVKWPGNLGIAATRRTEALIVLPLLSAHLPRLCVNRSVIHCTKRNAEVILKRLMSFHLIRLASPQSSSSHVCLNLPLGNFLQFIVTYNNSNNFRHCYCLIKMTLTLNSLKSRQQICMHFFYFQIIITARLTD